MNGISWASKTSKRKQYKFLFVNTQRACPTRVTVVVLCVSVWIRVYFISFLPPRVYRHQKYRNIDLPRHRKNFYSLYLLKMIILEGMESFASLKATDFT